MSERIAEWIETAINEMIKMKEEQPDLAIPMKFLEMYNSPEMLQFIRTAHAYAVALFPSEGSQGSPNSKQLEELAKAMALQYGQLLLRQSKARQTRREELTFYETLLFFTAKVLRPSFSKEQVAQLEDELNRLFRSTASTC